MAAFLDGCRFLPSAGGTSNFVYVSAVGGYQSPAAAGAVNGRKYKYRAESADLTQWELGEGTWSSGTGTLSRTNILFNSAGTTAAINFTATPQVAVVALAEDLGSPATMWGYLSGLTLSTAGSSSTFSISAGAAVDGGNTDFITLTSAISKTTAAWSVGSGNGALDTGTIANSTWYHVYAIKRSDTRVVDILVSLSASAPTLPSNYSLSRRIGSMKTDASGNWLAFVQNGDDFTFVSTIQDVNSTNPGTSGALAALSVPPGVNVDPHIVFGVTTTTSSLSAYVSSPQQTDQAVSFSAVTTIAVIGGQTGTIVLRGIWTDTSGRIRYRLNLSASTVTVFINTFGYTDRRGRDG